MNKMKANNFSIKAGRIDFKYCEVVENEFKEKNIFFELDNGIIPSNEAIACVIATFAGTKFDEIHIELPILEEIRKKIESFTKASVVAPVQTCKTLVHTDSNNIILNFSGGSDSLAAIYLIPGNIKLVSIDFDGAFKRERIFFERFHPYILKTNFRQEKLDRNSWTFMGAGALLYADYLEAQYNVFGTIFEATKYHFLPSPHSANNNNTPPFSFIGLKDIRFLNGLTEVGTVMVVSHYAPELINGSLCSLSAPKTEKRYRKETLLDIICRKYNYNIHYEKSEAPERKVNFGENLPLDFLSFYIIKNSGIAIANNTVINIPEDVLNLISKLKLDFYERLNCEFVCGDTFPNNVTRSYFLQRVSECGILPYTENDYFEYRMVIDLLDKYHHIY